MIYFEFTRYYFIWTVRTCHSLAPPRYGDIKCDDKCERDIYGSSCTARCQKGYDLQGDAKRTCKDGEWTGIVVRCESK